MKNKIVRLLATGFGCGYAPLAPGTFGSLPGLVLAYFLVSQGLLVYWVGVIVLSVLSIWVAHQAEQVFGAKDSQQIVIDEVAGQVLTFCWLPVMSWQIMLVGFLAFRLFDVIKLPPANWAQDKLPGGLGVVGDDLVAGLQAGVLLYLMQIYIFPYLGW